MLKKIKYVCYVAILFILIYLTNKGITDVSIIRNNHFNFITVNSIFGGFLFTSLGIIMSLYTNELLVKLERTSIMNDIYIDIYAGIIFSVVSIAISITSLLINVTKIQNIIVKNFLLFTMPTLELYFLIISLAQFVLSVNDIKFIIRTVRLNIKKNFLSKESINKTLEKIK